MSTGIPTALLATLDTIYRSQLQTCFSPANHVHLVNVDLFTAVQAQETVWTYNIDPKDAVHVASALQFKKTQLKDTDVFIFQTFDKKLINRASQISEILFDEPKSNPF